MSIHIAPSHEVIRDIRKYIPGSCLCGFRQVGMLPVGLCALWQLKPYPNILAATRTLHLQVASAKTARSIRVLSAEASRFYPHQRLDLKRFHEHNLVQQSHS